MLCVCVCVCERSCVWERERETERVMSQHISYLNRGVCVRACVCVCERERVTSQHIRYLNRVLCVCVCVCERERERDKVASQRYVQRGGNCLNRGLFETHTSFITVSVTWLCYPLGLELMVKLRTLLSVFTLIFSWSSRLWKGALHFRRGLAPFSYMLFHANCLTCAVHVPE